MYIIHAVPIDPPGDPVEILPDVDGKYTWIPDTPGVFQVTVTDGVETVSSNLVTVSPLPSGYATPGPLPTEEDTRKLVEGDSYIAAVGRQLLYDEPLTHWPVGVTAENVTLYAQRRLLYGSAFEGFSVPCVEVTTFGVDRLRVHVDLPAIAGHRANAPRRPGYYDVAIVASLDGESVTLAKETWIVYSTPRELAEAQA